MPALNFKVQFATDVESGEKRQTIRAYRKDGRDPKPGDRLVLYTGMRTKGCRKLGEATVSSVEPISIEESIFPDSTGEVRVSGRPLGAVAAIALAVNDGFADWMSLEEWFEKTHGLPFEGLLIRWDATRHPEDET